MRPVALVLLAAATVAGCAERPGSALCGISLLATPAVITEQFGVPRQTLGAPPRNLPERLPVRFAADALTSGVVGRTDSTIVIGVEGPAPAASVPGFGVLVTDMQGAVQGLMIFEGDPIPGAPPLGSVQVGERTVPLLGVRADFARIEDPRCPIFPPLEP